MKKNYYNGPLSINKDAKSPFWFVSFVGPDGKAHRKSTKVPVAGGMFEGEKISAKAAERLAYQRGVQIAIAKEEEYNAQNNVTVRDWFEGYISRNAGRISPRTVSNARAAYKFFYAFLGGRANAPLRLITKADVKNFVIARREQVRSATVKKDLAAISQACNDAVDAEVIPKNPCLRVSVPPDRACEKRIKEPFTLEEVRYMIDHFPPEWSSAVRCAFETYGQRLGDILKLDWAQFDWEARTVNFVTSKVARVMKQPMRDEFYSWARARWEAEGCPRSGLLHGTIRALGKDASYQFGLLLRTHKIGQISGSGDGRRRKLNTKSFHSIRSSCTTLLHASGVSEGMAMQLIGHQSKEVHAVYLKPTSEQLRDAAHNMPALNQTVPPSTNE